MTVRTSLESGVFHIELVRPEVRNAVDRATAEALADAFRAFEATESAGVAVLSGVGGSFCAGADLHGIAEGRGNRLAPDGDAPMGPSRMVLGKPLIAAIEGHAVAGGLELALLADLRVGGRTAVLGVFCRRWGVPLIDGGTARLPRVVGLSRALDLVLTGRPVDAAEAHAIGLLDRVVEPGTALDAAMALARSLLQFPQGCLRADRASVYAGLDLPLDQALAAEFARGVEVIAAESVTGARWFHEGQGRGGKPRGDA